MTITKLGAKRAGSSFLRGKKDSLMARRVAGVRRATRANSPLTHARVTRVKASD